MGCKWDDLASFGLIQSIFFNDLGGNRLAPKAEITGSNPVGCANSFNGLRDSSEGNGPWFVRIILVVVAPSIYEGKNRTCLEIGLLGFCGNRG